MAASEYLNLTVVGADDGVAVLEVAGEIDFCTVETVHNGIEEALRTGAQKVVIDLTGVSFIDVRGMDALVLDSVRIRGNGRSFAVRNPSPAVLRVEQLLHVDTSLLPLEVQD